MGTGTGKARLAPCTYFVFCDTFNCDQPAKWFLYNPDGPLSPASRLCEDCAKAVVAEAPEELRPEIPVSLVKELAAEAIVTLLTSDSAPGSGAWFFDALKQAGCHLESNEPQASAEDEAPPEAPESTNPPPSDPDQKSQPDDIGAKLGPPKAAKRAPAKKGAS